MSTRIGVFLAAVFVLALIDPPPPWPLAGGMILYVVIVLPAITGRQRGDVKTTEEECEAGRQNAQSGT